MCAYVTMYFEVEISVDNASIILSNASVSACVRQFSVADLQPTPASAYTSYHLTMIITISHNYNLCKKLFSLFTV